MGRLFARLYDVIMYGSDRGTMASWRRQVTAQATGVVLEIGVGSGFGLRHYDRDTMVVAIDPDGMMLRRARGRAVRSRARVLLVAADAQRLPFRATVFDSAVAQLALCSIPDQHAALTEVRRALRAGGTLCLLEHVRSDRSLVGRMQDWLTPVWKRIAGGCHLNREPVRDVERAGFAITRIVRHAGGLFQELTARVPPGAERAPNQLRLRRLGIDTYQEPVVYMVADCPVCGSEGWTAQARIRVTFESVSIIATLNVVTDSLLAPHEVGLSDAAWVLLGATEGDLLTVSHPRPTTSLSLVRGKLYGGRLSPRDFAEIVRDIVDGHYSAIELAAFVSACTGSRLDLPEIIGLTRAMLDVGDRLTWAASVVVDKHSVGGLPGNRTTMLVVPIVAAAGLVMPKTSSRAITSPAGTADAMETIAPVTLAVREMRRVVDSEGGCIVWGGAVRLSPADDLIIRVERPLDLDSEGQLVASVLSKKAAAGSTHVVIDMPIGPTAKVRTDAAAHALGAMLTAVGRDVGLVVEVCRGDGTQPIGRGIGPALEAWDVLAVLRGDPGAPRDLRDRALTLAGRVIELGQQLPQGDGVPIATALLHSGAALRKFESICAAQGGMREPPRAVHTSMIVASQGGVVCGIDNRRLARAAKLAGAPASQAAGLEVLVRAGDTCDRGQPLYRLHAQSRGQLEYALLYVRDNRDIVQVSDQ